MSFGGTNESAQDVDDDSWSPWSPRSHPPWMFLRLMWFGTISLGVSPHAVPHWPVLVVVEWIAVIGPDTVIGSVASNPAALDVFAPRRVVPVVTVAVVVSGRSGVVAVVAVVVWVVRWKV